MVWEEMSFEEFQDGGHLDYRNGMNLCPTVKPPIKFRLSPTYGFGGETLAAILDIGTERFLQV